MGPEAGKSSGIPWRAISLWGALLCLAALAVGNWSRSAWDLAFQPARVPPEAASRLFKSVSLSRLSVIERAVRVYYDDSGQYPARLERLTSARILEPRMLLDPYGRPYRYLLRPEAGRFGLYGRNAEGSIDLDLSFDRSLSPVSEASPLIENGRKLKKKEGVEVVE